MPIPIPALPIPLDQPLIHTLPAEELPTPGALLRVLRHASADQTIEVLARQVRESFGIVPAVHLVLNFGIYNTLGKLGTENTNRKNENKDTNPI